MVFIPRGVAHGGMVLDQKPVDVVYLANQQFSAGDPDEWRLPWDILGVEFWRVMKG
jgi:dTDP-4-dehydrorhamnose 3,5-epimerase